MDKKQKIALVPRQEKRMLTIVLVVVAVLFMVSSIQTRYQPFDFLVNSQQFWLFIGRDLFPPKLSDLRTIGESFVQTISMAFSATLVAACLSLLLAFLGSNASSPWKPLKKIIRLFASIQRNIPSLIWVFILTLSFGIGNLVGLLALLINGCGFLTRSFIETIDEVGAESLESMTSVGAGYFPTITQVIFPASLPGFIGWLLYSLEVNIRASALVGAVGGGGIGLIMMGYIKQFRYHSGMGIILLIAAMVILVDMLTNFLRKKVLA